MDAREADVALVSGFLKRKAPLEPACQMLLDGLPHASLGNPLQERFFKLQESTLQSLQKQGAARLEELTSSLEAAKAEEAAAMVAEETAAESEKACAALVVEKEHLVATRKAAVAKTKAEKAVADSALGVSNQAFGACTSRSERLSSLLDGPLRMLREGAWVDAETRDGAIEAVAELLKESKAEEALQAAACSAMGTPVDNRSAFDTFTITAVQELLQARLAAAEQEVLASQDEHFHLEAEALGLKALCEREAQEEGAAWAELCEAQTGVQQALDASKKTKAEVVRLRAALSNLLAEQVVGEEQQKEFAGLLEAAARLVVFDYETKAPAPAVAENVTDEGMAEAEAPPAAPEDTTGTQDKEMTAVEESLETSTPSKVDKGLATRGNPLGVASPIHAA